MPSLFQRPIYIPKNGGKRGTLGHGSLIYVKPTAIVLCIPYYYSRVESGLNIRAFNSFSRMFRTPSRIVLYNDRLDSRTVFPH
jgi:hypothetical protein